MRKVLFPGLVGEMARHGETQMDLAKILELSHQSVCRKFTGKSEWSISDIEKLCKHYDKNYYELFKRSEK